MATGDIQNSSLYMKPFLRRVAKLYSQVPTDGTGDFTVARNSVATYRNSAGLIASVLANVPRFEWEVDGSCPYYKSEPQRTNNFTYSNDFSNVAWIKAGATITQNYATAPDGTTTATRVQFAAGSWFFYQLVSLTISLDYTHGFYIKSNGGGLDTFRLYGQSTGSNMTATNEWVRYSKTITASATGLADFGIRADSVNAGLDILIWQSAHEQGEYLTSQIDCPTVASTRLKDEINIADIVTPNVMQGTNWTLHFDKKATNDVGTLSADDSVFRFLLSSVLKISIERYRDDSLRVYNYNDAVYMLGGTDGGTWSDAFTFSITYDNGDWIFYRDGVQVGTYSETLTTSLDELDVYCTYGSLNLGRLISFPETLTPTQIASL